MIKEKIVLWIGSCRMFVCKTFGSMISVSGTFVSMIFIMLTMVSLTGCTRKEEVILSLEETAQGSEDDAQQAVREQETDTVQSPVYAYVHICGAVTTPGVYKVEAGSRVYEVIELAGGLLPEACQEYRNQAQEVEDGMQIVIPTVQEVEDGTAASRQADAASGQSGVGASDAASGKADATSGKADVVLVNINTAGIAELCTLPGIGEARAESILRYRDNYGAFETTEDIMKVEGIKEKAYLKIKDKIRVK